MKKINLNKNIFVVLGLVLVISGLPAWAVLADSANQTVTILPEGTVVQQESSSSTTASLKTSFFSSEPLQVVAPEQPAQPPEPSPEEETTSQPELIAEPEQPILDEPVSEPVLDDQQTESPIDQVSEPEQLSNEEVVVIPDQQPSETNQPTEQTTAPSQSPSGSSSLIRKELLFEIQPDQTTVKSQLVSDSSLFTVGDTVELEGAIALPKNSEPAEVVVHYQIRDDQNNIILDETEVVRIDQVFYFKKNFQIAQGAVLGDYTLFLEVDYSGQKIVSTNTFQIATKSEVAPPEKDIVEDEAINEPQEPLNQDQQDQTFNEMVNDIKAELLNLADIAPFLETAADYLTYYEELIHKVSAIVLFAIALSNLLTYLPYLSALLFNALDKANIRRKKKTTKTDTTFKKIVKRIYKLTERVLRASAIPALVVGTFTTWAVTINDPSNPVSWVISVTYLTLLVLQVLFGK